jgi:hypothetical protein
LSRQNGTFWWDLRGNHDCFNVHGWNQSTNYFSSYGSSASAGFSLFLNKSFGNYLFLGIDGCPYRGLSRPYNFFGIFDVDDMDHLESQLEKYPNVNHTFAMGHYPTATTHISASSSGTLWDELSKKISVYMCGHLHRFKWGLGDHMYARHPSTGLVELELADMKKHATFRVVVVDNDRVSFSDVDMQLPLASQLGTLQSQQMYARLEAWPHVPQSPIIVVSHPLDGRFTTRDQMKGLQHVRERPLRMFIFSSAEPNNLSITIYLNGIIWTKDTRNLFKPNNVSGATTLPLWESDWDTTLELFSGSPNTLEILVHDKLQNLSARKTVIFKADGKEISIGFSIGRFILLAHFPIILKGLFWTGYTLLALILLLPKLFVCILALKSRTAYHDWRLSWSRRLRQTDHQAASRKVCDAVENAKFGIAAICMRSCELARRPNLWYPLFIVFIWLTTLPLIVGNFVFHKNANLESASPNAENFPFAFQAMYTFGFWISDSWHAGVDAWVYAVHLLWGVVLPFHGYTSCFTVPSEMLYHKGSVRRREPLHLWWPIQLLVLLGSSYHLYNHYMLSVFYGNAVLFASPVSWLYMWMIWTLAQMIRKNAE